MTTVLPGNLNHRRRYDKIRYDRNELDEFKGTRTIIRRIQVWSGMSCSPSAKPCSGKKSVTSLPVMHALFLAIGFAFQFLLVVIPASAHHIRSGIAPNNAAMMLDRNNPHIGNLPDTTPNTTELATNSTPTTNRRELQGCNIPGLGWSSVLQVGQHCALGGGWRSEMTIPQASPTLAEQPTVTALHGACLSLNLASIWYHTFMREERMVTYQTQCSCART